MDRARLNAERDHDKPRRPVWVTVTGVLLAISVVAIAGRGFDAFLSGFQQLLERIAQEEAEAEIRKPHPIFVVPEEQPAAPPEQRRNAARRMIGQVRTGPGEPSSIVNDAKTCERDSGSNTVSIATMSICARSRCRSRRR